MKNNRFYLLCSILALGMVACKGAVQDVQYPQGQVQPQPANPVVANPSPTFSECASSGWQKTKETASDLYDKAVKAYQEYEAAKKVEEEKKAQNSSEP